MEGEDWRQTSHPGDSPRVATFARRVLERVSHKPGQARSARIEAFAGWLAEYVARPDGFEDAEVLSEVARLRLTRDDLIVHCVPMAARQLGQRWTTSELTFAAVSIGSARLFGLVRAGSTEWSRVSPLETGLSFLLCTLSTEDHIIGSSVLAYQLRQAGHSVRSISRAGPDEIVERLDVGCFDGLLFSCATLGSLETVRKAVKHIRRTACLQPVFVLGGAVLHEADGLKEKTGVDLVTNDMHAAVGRVSVGVSRPLCEVAE